MENSDTILIMMPTNSADEAKLKASAAGCRLIFSDDSPSAKILGRADIIVGNPSPEQLKSAKRLRWLQLHSAGADVYTSGGLPDGVILTNASGAFGPAIGEYMLCAAMSLMLDFPQYHANQMRRLSRDEHKSRHVAGSVALSVGFGDLGREFSKRFHALGGRVIGVKRTPGEKPDYLDELHTVGDLGELLPRADVVALSLPATSETKGLFGRKEFALMKRSAVFVNAGRGSAVKTDDLCEALRSGTIAGAALDVTDPEPLPADHPLWDAPNLILTPHIAGSWEAIMGPDRVIDIFLDNLGRWLRGEPLKNVVDRRRGY